MPPQTQPSQDQATDIAKIQQDTTLGTSGNVGRTPGGMVNTLTGQMLAPTPYVDYKTPSPTPPESIGNLSIQTPAKIPLTAQETQADTLTQRLLDINSSLMGKTAYAQGKRTEFGIPEKEQTIQDLTQQFNDFQKKEAVINTEYGGSLAANRGVLEPFVTGERDARLRQNAIQALTISSTIDAANGLLASAQRKVNLAVEQKYGSIEEEFKIKKENLDILSKSPGLSRDEKDRAAAQSIALKNQELVIAQKKEDQKDIWTVSTTAAQNMQSFKPTTQYTTSAQAIQAIQNAKTKEEALRIATDTGLTTQKAIPNLPVSVEEYKFAQTPAGGSYKGTYAQYQNEDANRKAKAAAVSENPMRVLSATEAQSLGVPFGTTAAQAYGKIPVGAGGQEQNILKDFSAKLVDRKALNDAGTREQFIRQLQAQYPQIDKNDIARKVYEIYPDNYNK